jgi:hypothetical protein
MLKIEDLNMFLERAKELADEKNRDWLLGQKLRQMQTRNRLYGTADPKVTY